MEKARPKRPLIELNENQDGVPESSDGLIDVVMEDPAMLSREDLEDDLPGTIKPRVAT